MADQIGLLERLQDDVPVGMELEPTLTPEIMRQKIEATMEGFISLVRSKLEQIENKLTIILPLDGSFIPYHEFIKALKKHEDMPDILSKINFVFAAKEYDDEGHYKYVLSDEVTEEEDVLVLDDIYDSGDSSSEVNEITRSPVGKFQVVSLTRKEGKGFSQGDIPLHTYEDKWVASGFGMDCGKFSVRIVTKAIEDGTLRPTEGLMFFELHKQVEILERMCGVSFMINDGEAVERWRFDVPKVLRYIAVLKANCSYKGFEYDEVYTRLRAIQDRKGAQKFQVFEVEA
ncbi:MAG: hypothetical protein ABIM99_06315 [Candidatus Dojkabacteria bacterium]